MESHKEVRKATLLQYFIFFLKEKVNKYKYGSEVSTVGSEKKSENRK